MAWPLTPITTFVAKTTKITASFLNSIQSAINDIFTGAKTLKQVDVDGTGGAASSLAPGVSVLASGAIVSNGSYVDAGTFLSAATYKSSATAGSGQSVPIGQIFKDTTCVAWAVVANSGAATLTRGANIASVSRTAQGVVRVTLQNAVSVQLCPVPCLNNTTGQINAQAVSTSQIDVHTLDLASVGQDYNFFLLVFGG